MSSTSPSSAGSESLAFGNTYSDISSTTGSIPSSPTRSSPFAAMAITELVISEAHYLTSINRIGNALNKASEADTAAGRKESSTLRCVSDRWAEMTRMHTKFHDDVVAVNDNLRETAGLLNDLLVTLEPVLMDHCRDLSISLKKLIRRDQNSEHTAAEWESALRQPLDHLATYEEWLLRIDPQQNFCKDYISHLQGLIYKFKMVSDSNQHPRNMLRRLSTMARDVIKRRSSVQLLTQGTSAISIAIPESPTSPTTPNSASTQDSSDSMSTVCSPTTPPLSMPETTIMALNIADNDLSIDCTVTKPVSISNDTNNNNNNKSPILREKRLPMIPSDVTQETPTSPQEPGTPIADTFLASPHVKQQQQQQQQKLQHCSSSASALSITGTLATPSTETLVSSSSVSVHSSAETIIQVSQVHQRTNTMTAATTTATCQKFLNDKEARKATLRVGTSESIQAKANSLQSPSFHNNNSASARQTSVETLRRVSPTKTTKAEKPPVKSLISFWEQVSDPLDV
ncbi:hypothetical protein BGX33_001724 [Mortierella sp. NVP41]|nr:hypothetical protein BGX33_001724 [Mortierella sp. NVP41]